MRAWILDRQAAIEDGPLSLVEVATPRPAECELRIRVLVCGICRTDIHIAEGDLSLKKKPIVLGHEAVLFPPAGNLVEPALAQLQAGGTLVMAPVSSSSIVIRDYSANLWGRSIRTLYNVNMADAREFLVLAEDLDLEMGVTVFPFESLPDALIQTKQGRLKEPNAVLQVAREAGTYR